MIPYEINIDPKEWGSYFWHAMEAIACTLTIKNKEKIYTFFENLTETIPCQKCRSHYQLYFKEYDPKKYMENCVTLLMWLYRLKRQIKQRQQTELETSFKDYLEYLMTKYDIPEIQYHMDKNEEFRVLTNPRIEKKYHLKEYYSLLK